MIENALPATSRHRALPSLAIRQRGRSSPNGTLRLPLPRQKLAIPDPQATNRPASRSQIRPNLNQSSLRARRSPHTPIPKSP
jgi:hypothetical protein